MPEAEPAVMSRESTRHAVVSGEYVAVEEYVYGFKCTYFTGLYFIAPNPCRKAYQGVEAETYGFYRCSGLRSEAGFKPSEMLGFLMPRRRKTESKL